MSSYVASKMASNKLEGLLAPLLESDDEPNTGPDADKDASTNKVETVKQTFFQKLKTLVVYCGLVAAVAVSTAAMVFVPGTAIFVMGGMCIANVPYTALKERQILKAPSVRAMINKLRENANNLESGVDVLQENVNKLEPEAEKAAEVEQQLTNIADKQSVNVNALVDLVKESEIISAGMRDNLRQIVVQDIIKIVLHSDRDNDQTIDKKEAKMLALKIRLQLQEHKVELDTEKFLNAIGEEPSVPGVIAFVQKLLPSDKGKNEKGKNEKGKNEKGKNEKEKNEKDDADDDDDDYDDDDDADDSDSWSEDEDSDDEDDIYDMFYMAEDVRGSVDEARASFEGRPGPVSLMARHKKKHTKSSRILHGH